MEHTKTQKMGWEEKGEKKNVWMILKVWTPNRHWHYWITQKRRRWSQIFGLCAEQIQTVTFSNCFIRIWPKYFLNSHWLIFSIYMFNWKQMINQCSYVKLFVCASFLELHHKLYIPWMSNVRPELPILNQLTSNCHIKINNTVNLLQQSSSNLHTTWCKPWPFLPMMCVWQEY